MRNQEVAKCRIHSAKDGSLSVKGLSRVTLGINCLDKETFAKSRTSASRHTCIVGQDASQQSFYRIEEEGGNSDNVVC
jgi:hypothetical protein